MVRLQRVGRKNDPSFRVIIVDSKEAAQSGKAIEVVGSHDARNDKTELKADRIKYWMSVGAQVSQTVHNLLVKKGMIPGKTINVSSSKLGKKASAAVAATKAAEEKAQKEAEAKKAEEASSAAKAMEDKKAKEEAEAAAKAEAEKPAEEVAPVEESAPASAEATAGEPVAEEAPVAEVAPEETPAEEEKPAE